MIIHAANDPGDHFACMKCGTLEHIELLDAKAPPGHPDPDNANFEHFECIECYGPGWETNLTAEEMQSLSVALRLRQQYLNYYRGTAE